MKVDGKIIKPTTHYTFSSNGNKQVIYYLKMDLQQCKICLEIVLL